MPLKKNWDHPDNVRRFWARVQKCPDCSCQLFTGALDRNWGRFWVPRFPGCIRDMVKAHRYSYALRYGPIPLGCDIHHDHDICNHRNCVDSDHLNAIDHDTHGEISKDYQWNTPEAWAATLDLF